MKAFPAMFAVIEHPREGVILYDTGYSQRFTEETRGWPNRIYSLITPMHLRPGEAAVDQLAARGIQPRDVRAVICSHFHGDHIAGIADFPRARYLFFAEAFDTMRTRSGLHAVLSAWLPGLLPPDFEARMDPVTRERLRPLPGDMAPFAVGVDLLGDGCLWAIPTPGHTHGHLALWIREPRGWGGDVFLVGDAAWSIESIVRRRIPTRLTRFIFDDLLTYEVTMEALATLYERGTAVRIIPSHCEHTLEEVGAWLPDRRSCLLLPPGGIMSPGAGAPAGPPSGQ